MCGGSSKSSSSEEKITTTTTTTNIRDVGFTGDQAARTIQDIINYGTDTSIGAFKSLQEVNANAMASLTQAGNLTELQLKRDEKGLEAYMNVVQESGAQMKQLVGGANDFVKTSNNLSHSMIEQANRAATTNLLSSERVIEDNRALTESTIARAQNVSGAILDKSLSFGVSAEAMGMRLLAESSNMGKDLMAHAASQTNQGASVVTSKYVMYAAIAVVTVVGITKMGGK